MAPTSFAASLGAVIAISFLVTGCTVSEVKPAGSWRTIKQGSYETIQWKLFATDPVEGGTCISFETAGGVERSLELPAEELYRGKVPACMFTPKEGTNNRYLKAIRSMDYGSREMGQRNYGFLIGLVDPAVKAVTVRVDNGGGVHSVDTSDGYLAFVHDASMSPEKVTVQAAGKRIDCDVDPDAPLGEVNC